MVVEAFLSWTDKARAGDRAKAAKALGTAYVTSALPKDKQAGAYMAMSYLLDDPSPKVRQALADALSCSEDAPRPIIIALAEDQAEIACQVIINSPVLRESDLVDLIGRGSSTTRAMIAARADLSAGVCAAMAEIGSECESHDHAGESFGADHALHAAASLGAFWRRAGTPQSTLGA
ncbi:DUF2336 domain-containing protein [Agrobacterium larrymoorei]|uniref:DUF2336 domain-containing protein n=1 Tax=Agrobacterium larrymoorei TaxID=160699 RepID=UPI00286D0DB6|nr:DUF2336 domain-containing protein [Agrobacterium larrymoorei]